MLFFLILSRIITFFPYFLLGYYTKNANVKFISLRKENGKYNKSLLVFWGIIAIISFAYFWNKKNVLKSNWLYGALSYNLGGYTCIFKTMWILVSLFEIVFFDNFMLDKKLPIISKIGTNTLYIYLTHGIIIKYLRYKKNIFIFSEILNLILNFIVTSIIVLLFGYVLDKGKFLKMKKN